MGGGPGDEGRRGRREGTRLLLAVCLSAFLTPFLSSALNLAVPAIGADLGASAVELEAVVTVYLIAAAALLLPAGRLADIWGRRRIFLLGIAGQGTALLGAALAGSPGQLVALRLVQGATGALPFATAMALLVDAFPASERGRVLGISTAAVYLGLSLGPIAGGLIVQTFGWRAIFLLGALLNLLLALLFATGIGPPEAVATPRERFDLAGAGLYAASVGALVGGLSALEAAPAARWAMAAGVAGLVLFARRDLAAPRPLLALRLFLRPVFAFSNLAALLHYSATFAVSFLLSLYLQVARGLSPRAAGLVLLAQPVVMALLSPAAGRLSDRVEPRRVASLGMGLTAVGLGGFALLGEATPLWRVVAGLVAIGAGFGLFSSPNSNAVMSAVGRADYGSAAAILGTMRLLGQSLSMAAVAVLTAGYLGAARLSTGIAGPLLAAQRTAFLLFALLCAAGVGASLARGRLRAPAAG